MFLTSAQVLVMASSVDVRDMAIPIRSDDCFDNHIEVQPIPCCFLCIKIVDSKDGGVELLTKRTVTTALLC